MPIKILLVDDHEVVRLGFKQLIASTEIKIVAEASGGDQAVKMVNKFKPDVVVLDIQMQAGDGLTALTKIKLDHPELPVLMYSGFDNPTYLARAMALGASGFVLKSEDKATLISSIKAAAAGEPIWTKSDYRRISGGIASPKLASIIETPLTNREMDVLKQVAHGLTNKEIALALDISYETVKEHVQNMLRKMGVNDRTQAAVWAVRKGIV